MLGAKENYKSHVLYKGIQNFFFYYYYYAIHHLASTLYLMSYIMIFSKIRNSYNKIGQEVTHTKLLCTDTP